MTRTFENPLSRTSEKQVTPLYPSSSLGSIRQGTPLLST
jgi:hypothetical protein